MPRTRSKGGPAATSSSSSSNSNSAAKAPKASRYSLPTESSSNPPKVFILPKAATPDAKVVSLPNPRSSKPTRYLVCPETGIYEFTRVAAPKSTPRSWLMERCGASSGDASNHGTAAAASSAASFDAQVTTSADLYVASPMDPLFLVLPALAAVPPSKGGDTPKRMFLSSDDHLDALPQGGGDSHMSEVLRWGQRTRKLVEARMAAVCDTVAAGDEPMFRLQEEKLLHELLAKAMRMAEAGGLPRSMEEKFVTKALEAPVMSLRRTAADDQTAPPPTTTTGASTPLLDSADSQSSTPSTTTTGDAASSFVSEASTAATSVADDTAATSGAVTVALRASTDVVRLQQLRVAFHFICSRYLPPALAEVLKKRLAEQKEVDFAPLDEYTAQLAKLRQNVMLARSASDFSRKRAREDEEDEKAEKRRKKEEEDKRRKANESRGVKELKKVNVSGMMKLSHFFAKKT